MGSDFFYLARVCSAYNMGSDLLYLARVCIAYNMGSDWFYLARVCSAYNLGLDLFYLAREYEVPIKRFRLVLSCQRICGAYQKVQTGFILPESMWCLLYGFRLVSSCQRVSGAYYVGSNWFYLAREYMVRITLFLTGFYLARKYEYVVPIIWIQTDLSCQRECGAYYIVSDWFYLARQYVVPIILFLTGFILPESMWCLLYCF